ncbi:MAG: ElyC/SanA/YdcF family protein [Nitrospirota bacterium]
MVFEAAVWPHMPSLSLPVRVARATELYATDWAPMIFCTGGWANKPSIATVMRGLLLKQGIPTPLIISDDGGISSHALVQPITRYQEGRWNKIIAVSSLYHRHRINREGKRQGLKIILRPAELKHSRIWRHILSMSDNIFEC